MLPIHFAPIQGYTDCTYRALHASLIGGIEEYYTPFVRWEKGDLRNKDRRDLDPSRNTHNTTAQIIFKDRDEFLRLTEQVMAIGWRKIDLNMGCPFPLQTHAGRGAGILQHPEIVEQIAREIAAIPEAAFSVKMRIGMAHESEGMEILQILSQAPLRHIVLHPRLGQQQYRGLADKDAYARFLNQSAHPMIYNGDLATPDEMHQIEQQFPATAALMIGRGLMARPTLAVEYADGKSLTPQQQLSSVMKLHEGVYRHALENLQGEAQILSKLQTFWTPLEKMLDKKQFKALTKCGNLRKYREALPKQTAFGTN